MDKILRFLHFKRAPWGIREVILDKGTAVLRKAKYTKISKIGGGGYGDVVRLRAPDKKKTKLAAKLVSSFIPAEGEQVLWSTFNHQNIVPLLNVFRDPEFFIYIMPRYDTSLDVLLEENRFRYSVQAFETTKTILRDVLQGLTYLHDLNVAHLDLKVDNVLITSDMHAVIADFSCTSTISDENVNYGLTKFFRPPEVCSSLGKFVPVNGRTFDVWSFGILVHYTWTRIASQGGVDKKKYWIEFVYPMLFDSLQLSNFRNLLQENFPNSQVHDPDLIYGLNLLKGLLRYKPETRPNLAEISDHPLISDDHKSNLIEVDDIWVWKQSFEENDSTLKADIKEPCEEIKPLNNVDVSGDVEMEVKVPDTASDRHHDTSEKYTVKPNGVFFNNELFKAEQPSPKVKNMKFSSLNNDRLRLPSSLPISKEFLQSDVLKSTSNSLPMELCKFSSRELIEPKHLPSGLNCMEARRKEASTDNDDQEPDANTVIEQNVKNKTRKSNHVMRFRSWVLKRWNRLRRQNK